MRAYQSSAYERNSVAAFAGASSALPAAALLLLASQKSAELSRTGLTSAGADSPGTFYPALAGPGSAALACRSAPETPLSVCSATENATQFVLFPVLSARFLLRSAAPASERRRSCPCPGFAAESAASVSPPCSRL